MARRATIGLLVVLAMVIAGCGDDDDATEADDDATEAGADQTDEAAQDDGTEDDNRDGGGDDGNVPVPAAEAGTLNLGDETIEMENVGCFLEEQPRAGLGGTFEFSIQGHGTNAAGEQVVVDITRVRPDEDGGPLGNEEPHDSVKVDVGEPGSATSYTANGPVGTVTVDGSSVTAGVLQASSLTGGASLDVSFELGCSGF